MIDIICKFSDYRKTPAMDLKKIIAKLPASYIDDTSGLSPEKLKAEIIQSETNIQRIEQEREADDKLSGARELVKDLSAPYRDAIVAQRAKIAYVMFLLSEKGQLPEATESVSDGDD